MFDYTLFFHKNHAYKNVDAQITQKIKNIVVILLVAISISFPASDEIKTFLLGVDTKGEDESHEIYQ